MQSRFEDGKTRDRGHWLGDCWWGGGGERMGLVRESRGMHTFRVGWVSVLILLVVIEGGVAGVGLFSPRRDVEKMEGGGVGEARRAFGRGLDAFNQRRFEDSVAHFESASLHSSHYKASSLFNMALVFESEGDSAKAQLLFQAAIAEEASGGGGWRGVEAGSRTRLGLMCGKAGDYQCAKDRFEEALRVEGDSVVARRNVIVAMRGLGDEDGAEKAARELEEEDPGLMGSEMEQTHVMNQAGDVGLPGTGLMERWMECDLRVLVEEGGWLDARPEDCVIADGERFLQEGVIEAPDDKSMWFQLGSFYRNLDRTWDCARALQQALRLEPGDAPSLAVLGGALADNRNYSMAVRPLESALALHAGDLYARANLILSLAWTCQWQKNEVHMRHFVQQLSNGIAGDLQSFPAPAHMLFIIGGPPNELPLHTYRQWVDLWSLEMTSRVNPKPFVPAHPTLQQGARLRVGYVSGAGFQRSPGSSAIRGVFGMHDRGLVEVYCFALKPDLGGNDLRGNVSKACDVFVEAGNEQNDTSLAWLINSHAPHVIVDLSGFSGDHRIRMLAHQPAPLSLTWLEYPGTLGAATGMDGIVTDRVASPPEYRLAYSEALLVVPTPYLPNDYSATVPSPPDALSPFPEQHPRTFCALHHVWKMDVSVFSAWMALLRSAPGSVLRLQDCAPEAKESLRALAMKQNVEPERLVFNARIGGYYEHIEKLAKCSLFLDAPRYNAHTSAADALWAGVPIVTWPLQMMVHRGAACLLESIGLSMTMSRDLHDYQALAIALAGSSEGLESARMVIRQGRDKRRLFDTLGWTGAFERGVRMMFDAKTMTGRSMHTIPLRYE